MNNRTLVILPRWIWNDAKDNDDFKVNLAKYMDRNYPGYRIINVERYAAICERG